MANVTLIQTNLNAGELAPDLGGHVDLDRYANGLKTGVNAVVQVEGGARRRPGSRIISPAKYGDRTTRLVPFVFNKSQAYVIELGDNYARFFTVAGQIVNGGAPIELATPYGQAAVFGLEYAQRSDTMLTADGAQPIKRISRVTNEVWSIGDTPFDPGPLEEIGKRPAATLTLSGTSALLAITVSASAASFIESDVGRNVVAGPGIAKITAIADAQHASATVSTSFDATSYAAGEWKLDGSPQVAISPSVSTPVDGAVTLYAEGDPVAVQSLSLSGSTMTVVTQVAHGLAVAQQVDLSGFESSGLDGLYTIASVPNATTFTFGFSGSLLEGGTFGAVYPHAAGVAWQASDVGSYVDLNGGYIEITGIEADGTKAYGRIVTALDATIAAPASSWRLLSAAWNAYDGYPRALSFYQQRLYAAGTPGFPERFWGSATGGYFDFTPGTNDGDSFSYSADSDQVNEVVHLSSSRILTLLTLGEEFTADGGTGNSITPTNINVRSQSNYGSAQARPVRVANELVYLQRASKKVRSMQYDFNTDAYRSQNLTRLASHITGPGIVDMAYQAEPNPVVWMVRSDGVLVSMTYSADDSVCGFMRHTTDGLYKSVAVIPGDDGDIVFVLVQRTINGAKVQYVEQLDQSVMTDAAIVGTNAAGATVWAGLGALEGKACDVKADGVFMGQFTVTGGQITLPRSAQAIEVGLHYDTSITTLSPQVGTAIGTSQSNAQRASQVVVRVLNTTNMLVGGQRIVTRQFGANMLDKPPPVVTGDVDITEFGWSKENELTIGTDQPYDWYVLAILRRFTFNAG